MNDKELLKLSAKELVDLGICPTCFNREHNGALYGDNKDKLIYEDIDIECFFVGNPRADGHMCISTINHYHDMSEAPDYINEKIIRFAKQFMIIIKEVYKSNPSLIPFKYHKGQLTLQMKKNLFKTNLDAISQEMLLISYKYM